MRVFETNTCLWGGIYNGIVPCYSARPSWWSDSRIDRLTAKEIIREYLNAFQPDFIVATEEVLRDKVDAPEWQVIGLDDILAADKNTEIQFGLPVTDYYHRLYEEEFKFIRKKPASVFLPYVQDLTWKIFAAATFGAYPSEVPFSTYAETFKDLLSGENKLLTCDTLFDIDQGLFPLRAGSFGLKVQQAGLQTDPALFLMSHTQAIDLIDFWNLRALGRVVWPIPLEWTDGLADSCKRLIEQIHQPYRNNPDMMHSTTLLKSRKAPEDLFAKFYEEIRLHKPKGKRHAVIQQTWYPRIWDAWTRRQGHIRRPIVFLQDDTEEVDIIDSRITFEILAPDFVKNSGSSFATRWANVLNFRDYSSYGEIPTCFPDDFDECSTMFRTGGFQKITATAEGLVVRCSYKLSQEYWEMPTSEAMLSSWLQQRGLEMTISSAGKTCKQILRSVGGPVGARLFNCAELVKLLNKMASGMVEDDTPPHERKRPKRNFVTEQELIAALKRRNLGSQRMLDTHLNALIGRKVLRVGLRVKCTECDQVNWYSLDGVNEQLRCERCLAQFDFPSVHPTDKTKWTYRPLGPFSTENFARGSYTIALSLRVLFSASHFEGTTWATGIEIKKGREVLEADFLAVVDSSSHFSQTNARVIIGECKSFNRFDEIDFRRAASLIETFPSATFCFATMREELEVEERAAIAEIAKKGREHGKSEPWRNPVIILTGTELLY